jgi:polysaccharide pyruvyl transferase CsaB
MMVMNRDSASHNVLIAGYYGFGNTGDETILEAMIHDFRILEPDIYIVVVSGNPLETANLHQVQSVPWADIQEIIAAMKTCDLVILGGGGIFHDYWGFDRSTILTSNHIGISFYSSIALLSSILNKRLMLYSVGVGPLLSEEGKTYVRVIAEQASIITVRDKESKEQLEALNISADRIVVTADPSFRLQVPQTWKDTEGIYAKGKFLVGVALRNWDVGVQPEYWEANVAKAIDRFLDNYPNTSVIFIPFQDSQEQLLDDQLISTRVQRLLRNSKRTKVILGTSTYFERVTNLVRCDFVLGMRLHSLILAIRSGIPVVGLIYDPKVKNLMSQVGIGKYAINLIDATDAVITTTIDKLILNMSKISVRLHKTSSHLAEVAFQNAIIVYDLLSKTSDQPPEISLETENIYKSSMLSLVESLETRTKMLREISGKELQQEANIAKINLHRNELDSQISKQEKNLEILKEELETLSERNEELLIEILDIHNHLNGLAQEYDKLKVLYDDQIKINDLWMNDRKKLELEIETFQKIHTKHLNIISKLKDKNNKLTTDLIESQRMENSEYSQKIDILEKKSGEKLREITYLTNELDNIKKSRGWKLLWGLWQCRLFMIPLHSRRERLVAKLYRNTRSLFSSPVLYGKNILIRIFNKTGLRLSNQAFAFHLYKKSRDRLFRIKTDSLHVPCQPGLVSIVLPVYNGCEYLRGSLDSILNQTYSQFEILIVDDGSTDDSGQISDEYAAKDKRVKVIHQTNQRLPQALNNGFRLAIGEFLTWTSHDNIMKPEFLEQMVECLSGHPSWDMVYANMDIIGEDGNPLYNSDWYGGYQVPYGSDHIHLPTSTLELNTMPNNYIGGAFLYRNQVNNLLAGYSSTQFTREDYDYWMQVNSLLTLHHTDFNFPIYDYRFHSRSLTSQDDTLRITSNRKYLLVFDDFRRDFYLMPMIYVVDSDNEDKDISTQLRAIRNILKGLGNIIISVEEYFNYSLPHLWIPSVYLKITSNPLSIIPPGIREKDIPKAMVCVSDQPQPVSINPGWDICLSYGSDEHPPEINSDCHGWWSSKDISTLINSLDIYIRSHHLKKIEKATLQSPDLDVKISVIICTYKRNKILEKSLISIANQTLRQQDYEVIVVDNNPEESDLSTLIDQIRTEEFYDHPDHLRLVQCPILGLSYARNAGLAEAKSGLLLFLDDDAIAKRDILEQYCQAFSEHPEAGVVGGHIILKRPEILSITWKEGWERYWSQFITGFNEFKTVTHWWEFPWGANWCANSKALMQIGGFRGRYGRRGNDFNGGEEIIAASLIQQLGYSIAILPQAEVTHYVDDTRFTVEHLKSTIKSSLFVHYLAQQNLHLPVESNVRNTIYQMNEAIRKCVFLILHPKDSRNKANLMEVNFQLSARIQLLFRQIIDGFRRFRFL